MKTGYFARATEKNHTAKSTMIHVLKNERCLCGYKPHKTMQFLINSNGIYLDYIECPKCKEKAKEIMQHLCKTLKSL